MIHSILASYAFWLSFVFSIGPFWIAVMEAAQYTSWQNLLKNFAIYQMVSWAPQVYFIAIVVNSVGGLHPNLLLAMHLVGGVVILYLAYKLLQAKLQKVKFDFHWKTMIIVSWSSPKVWVTIPIGSLSAQYTENLWYNSFLFYLLGCPLFFIGLFFWSFIGRQGAKIMKEKFSYITSGLLAFFGIYLLIQGILEANI